jgi:hypothetical protein
MGWMAGSMMLCMPQCIDNPSTHLTQLMWKHLHQARGCGSVSLHPVTEQWDINQDRVPVGYLQVIQANQGTPSSRQRPGQAVGTDVPAANRLAQAHGFIHRWELPFHKACAQITNAGMPPLLRHIAWVAVQRHTLTTVRVKLHCRAICTAIW